MLLAAFCAVGFGVAGVHALLLLRRPDSGLHRRALRLALPVGALAAGALPVSGDWLAKRVAALQPVKLAAMEGLFHSEAPAALRLLGWPDQQAGVTRYALELPGLLSWLAHGDLQAEVQGLEQFPRELWPPVAVTHIAFQLMVLAGSWLLLVALLAAVLAVRRRAWSSARWFLRLLVVSAPLGFLAIEAGWVVTEVGRQPWIVQGVLRTADMVTPRAPLAVPLLGFALLYLLLFAVVFRLLRRQVFASLETGHA